MKAAHLRDEINPFASVFCGPYAELAIEDYRFRSLLTELNVVATGAAQSRVFEPLRIALLRVRRTAAASESFI
jgi:hypothetical protein